MEIIVALALIVVAGYFIFRPKKVEETPAVPYKVETPAPTPVAEKAAEAVVVSLEPKAKTKKAPAKKTAAKKTATKKPRATKKPKA